jgi:hypothetical protein
MNLPSRSIALSLLAVLGLTGCINDRLNAPRDRVAFISAQAFSTGGGAYATRPLAAFYRANGLDLNLGEVEACVGVPFSNQPAPVATFPTLSAGQYLFTDLGGRRDTLFSSSTLGLQTYQLLTVNSIPYVPGDTLSVEVPGDVAGFPGTTIRVRTAEEFDFTVPANPVENEPMTLTWTPAPSPGSTMTVSLRLNNTGTGNDPDAQIYCRFNDDGSGVVPATLTAVWRAAVPESRSTFFSRVRFTTIEFDARTRLTLLSYFDRPTLPIPTE